MKAVFLTVFLLLFVSSATPAEQSWRVVLVAGDGGIRAFDNAAKRLAGWLHLSGNVSKNRIARLSAAPAIVSRGEIPASTLYHVAQAVGAMKPAAGEACLVFVTSHGLPDEGVALSWKEEILSPPLLNRLLNAGCGDAPTVAIVSACYSGNFTTEPMARANRIVVSAARADRPSFGCGASDVYTFFDQCLINQLRAGSRWVDVFDDVRACVRKREAREDYTPSEPQVFVGARMLDFTLPR